MSNTKRLHELIDLAKAGKRFRAKRIDSAFYDHGDFSDPTTTWTVEAITDIWKYEEIKEPRVVEFNLDCTVMDPEIALDHARWGAPRSKIRELKKSKWKIVATEVIDE